MIIELDFKIMGNEKGSLIALEQNKQIPFDIKRVYYIFDTSKGVRRGFHAHKNLKQVLVAIKGSCKLLFKDGVSSQTIELNDPKKGIFIDSVIWREMYDFSQDCVLMVLADQIYDPDDYIRDYSEFMDYVKKHGA